MHIDCHRKISNPFCIIGDFDVDSGRSYKSLELPLTFDGQENVPDKTCIPAETYDLVNLYSEKHQKMMPHIYSVEHRTAIEIHAASCPDNLLGCTAIGNHLVTQNPQSAADVVINGSQDAFAEFYNEYEQAIAAGERVTITYTNDF